MMESERSGKAVKSMVSDMTKGNLTKEILVYALPICLGSIFQQFYNLADAIIVGRILGTDALAGVGSTTGLTFLIYSLANGLSNGFSVSVAQRFGAGDPEGLKRRFGNGISLALIITAVLTMLFSAFCGPVLTLVKTPKEIYGYAYNYVIVCFAGLFCTVSYNYLAAHLRAVGDSRTPVIALIAASFLNVGLDLLFVAVFSMGVAGAAFATIISQLVSAVFLLFYIVRKVDMFRLKREHFRLSKDLSGEQLATAVPMGIQGSVIAIGIMIVQAATNGMGTIYVAGSMAGNKLYGIMAAPIDAVCQAMIPIAGQNYGAGKLKRIDQGLRRIMVLTWAAAALLIAIAVFLGKYMIGWFIDPSETEVIQLGHQFLIYFVAGYGFLAIQLAYCFALQGIGLAKYTIMSGILETAGRIAGAVFLTGWMGYTGVCLALPLAWIFTSVYLLPVYYLKRGAISDRS
jgi:putative MATE family efflux protein